MPAFPTEARNMRVFLQCTRACIVTPCQHVPDMFVELAQKLHCDSVSPAQHECCCRGGGWHQLRSADRDFHGAADWNGKDRLLLRAHSAAVVCLQCCYRVLQHCHILPSNIQSEDLLHLHLRTLHPALSSSDEVPCTISFSHLHIHLSSLTELKAVSDLVLRTRGKLVRGHGNVIAVKHCATPS